LDTFVAEVLPDQKETSAPAAGALAKWLPWSATASTMRRVGAGHLVLPRHRRMWHWPLSGGAHHRTCVACPRAIPSRGATLTTIKEGESFLAFFFIVLPHPRRGLWFLCPILYAGAMESCGRFCDRLLPASARGSRTINHKTTKAQEVFWFSLCLVVKNSGWFGSINAFHLVCNPNQSY